MLEPRTRRQSRKPRRSLAVRVIAGILAWPAAVLVGVPASGPSSALAADIDDHPLVSRYEGSVASRRDEEAFQSYDLVTGLVEDSLDFVSQPLSGRVTRIAYENPGERSALEILANYEQAIVAAGGDVLFTCRETACGPAWAGSRWGRFNGTIHLPGVGGYVAGRIVSGEQVAFVAIGVANRRHQVTVVEIADMDTGLVRIDPEALGQALDQMGHVAIPGVHFETGKARLVAESAEALAAMATILAARPSLAVWVVGHTDWTGDFELNARLSRDRARAVVDALVEQHGIDVARLEGHGVGPLSPTAANDGDSGRQANRRVELVRRP